ncbi:hypothetical protein AVEN_153934-1 [Araneus ventricosus]|uniref:Uncharacterized protein n=1 Tax=Araneus ventricosus TaxID=182803 RepID=A0A4Y2F6Z6_ARAVE|nr:hypothetical protein AVEN_153934-1 [Araneus ventricosus]
MAVILDNESEEGDAPAPTDMVDEQLECEDIEFMSMIHSHHPPHHAAVGGLKLHLIFLMVDINRFVCNSLLISNSGRPLFYGKYTSYLLSSSLVIVSWKKSTVSSSVTCLDLTSAESFTPMASRLHNSVKSKLVAYS